MQSPSARPIVASGIVPAARSVTFAFLAELENHWLLADRFVQVLALDGPAGANDGGTVIVRGPLGIRRRARIRVAASQAPESLKGTARIGGRTRAMVSWTLEEHPRGTRVRLEAFVQQAGVLDRALLAVGGRRWMAGCFSTVIDAIPASMASARTRSRSDSLWLTAGAQNQARVGTAP